MPGLEPMAMPAARPSLVWMSQWVGARERQEDHCAVLDPQDSVFRAHAGLLAIVADGMGGMSHGEAASRCAVSTFLQEWERKSDSEPVSVALRRCLSAANAAVVRESGVLAAPGEMGCTFIAAVVREYGAEWISVGDSVLLHLRGTEVTQLNTPHTFAEQLDREVARGEREANNAAADPQRVALLSFLGLDEMPLVDRTVRPFPLREGDVLVLASDGLTNTLSNDEIAHLVLAASRDADLAATLIDAAKLRPAPSQDNTSVIVIRIASRETIQTAPLAPAGRFGGQRPDANLPDATLPEANPPDASFAELQQAWRIVAGPPVAKARPQRLYLLAKLAALFLAVAIILLGIYFGPGPFGVGDNAKQSVPGGRPDPANDAPIRKSEGERDVAPTQAAPSEPASPAEPEGPRKSAFGDDAGDTVRGGVAGSSLLTPGAVDKAKATQPTSDPTQTNPLRREKR